MKILVTGANGLLGQKLVSLILSQPGHELIATGRGESRLAHFGKVNYHQMDITDPNSVQTVLTETRPDAVINCAAMTQVDDCETEREACWLLNVTAVENLANSCKDLDIFLLQVSTDFIFDGEAGPYDEEAEPAPVNYYGESKLEAERVIQKTEKLRWAIGRTILVFGVTPGLSRSNIILWVKKSLEDGKSLRLVTDQFRTPTLAEDLAAGCFLIAAGQHEGIYNVAGKELLTPYDMAIITADYFGLDKELISKTDSSQFQQKAKRPPRTGLDITKLQALGYSPRSFREGIEVMVGQLTEN